MKNHTHKPSAESRQPMAPSANQGFPDGHRMGDPVHEILIVEDNVEFRTTLAETLKARFPNVLVSQAGDGTEAFRKIDHKPPDLIFMDLRLPGPSGLVLTREVKKRNPSIIVMVLTHLDSLEYRDAAFQSGADLFLSKETTDAEGILSLVELAYNMGTRTLVPTRAIQ